MSDKITVTYDLQDFPEHKKLRDTLMDPKVKKLLSALHESGYRVINENDEPVSDVQLLCLVIDINEVVLRCERDAALMSAQKAFKVLCEPTK